MVTNQKVRTKIKTKIKAKILVAADGYRKK